MVNTGYLCPHCHLHFKTVKDKTKDGKVCKYRRKCPYCGKTSNWDTNGTYKPDR